MVDNDKRVKPSSPSKEFLIKQLLLKKLDFDVLTPLHTLKSKWQPDAKLDLNIGHDKSSSPDYCIEIKLSIHVSIDKKSVFAINIIYGGVFQMKGYSDDEMKRLINSFCPNMLFPYARQVVSQTTTQAGFPPLNLSPIDFEARYRASNS